MKSVPCATCPWRRSSTIGGADIPGFNRDKMRNLSCTVGSGDAFRTIMACHHSPEGEEEHCIGYVAVEGWSNLAVRMGAISGRVPMNEILSNAEGLDLFASFEEMLDAYEEVWVEEDAS